MKKLYIILLLLGWEFIPAPAVAQNKGEITLPTDSVSHPEATFSMASDTALSVPLVSPVPQVGYIPPFGMYGITPFDYSYATWELHKGFNASIGFNLTFSPDRYAPSGVGFGQDAAFMYAIPINSRLSVAGGLYVSNMDWGFLNYRDIGIAGVAAYKLNDRISLYAYGNKSLTRQRPYYAYPLPNYCPDRIGGMINFKLGESSSISIGVEGRKNDYPWWY